MKQKLSAFDQGVVFRTHPLGSSALAVGETRNAFAAFILHFVRKRVATSRRASGAN